MRGLDIWEESPDYEVNVHEDKNKWHALEMLTDQQQLS